MERQQTKKMLRKEKPALTKEQVKYIDDTLLANKDKLFIDRMMNPEKYPMIDDEPLDAKTVMGKQRRSLATHKMANADNLVFPTIIAEKDAMGKPYLVDLEKKYKVREKPEGSEERRKALNSMIDELEKKGQVIRVESPEKAKLIAENYKQSSVGKKLETGFQEGGLLQEGGTVDPVSGNDVPIGSTQEEVRDDIPAQLSEGEFVFPADVVRFIGLDNLMKLRQEAKAGLAKMDRMGQMGNSEEAVEDDTGEFDTDIDDIIGEIEREARMAQPEEEKTEEETPVKKSDEERLGFNIGGLGTKDDSSENKEEEDKKITTAPTTPVAPKADTKDAAMNILGKKYDVSQQPTSKELAQSILEKKYGKGVTAKRIAGIEDIEKSAMGSVKDRSTLESTYTMTKDEYSKLDQAGAQDHIYNQILNQNNVFLADQGVNYQGKQSDKEFIFRHMAKDLAAAGIKDLRQLGSEETPIIENVKLTKKGDKYYRTVEDKSKPLGMGGYGTKQVEVDPADLLSEPETKQVTKSLNYAGMTKEVPVTTAKVKVGATTTLVNKETGEKVVQGKYGGNLTEYQKGQGFRWGNTTSVEGMADYMISFDDKGQPLVYPRYEDTTSGFVAPLLKGAMLAATIYGGYTLANTFATKGLAAGAKKVGKKLIQKQVSKALD